MYRVIDYFFVTLSYGSSNPEPVWLDVETYPKDLPGSAVDDFSLLVWIWTDIWNRVLSFHRMALAGIIQVGKNPGKDLWRTLIFEAAEGTAERLIVGAHYAVFTGEAQSPAIRDIILCTAPEAAG